MINNEITTIKGMENTQKALNQAKNRMAFGKKKATKNAIIWALLRILRKKLKGGGFNNYTQSSGTFRKGLSIVLQNIFQSFFYCAEMYTFYFYKIIMI